MGGGGGVAVFDQKIAHKMELRLHQVSGPETGSI